MKKIIFALFLGSASLANAQYGGFPGMNLGQAPSHESSFAGMYVGLDYMNLTDFHADLTTSVPGDQKSSHTETGGSLGLAGIKMGYSKVPVFGPGYEVGIRYLQSFNNNETNGSSVQMVIPEANLAVGFGGPFVGFLGVNTAFFVDADDAKYLKPNIGGQVGMGLHLTEGLRANVAYTAIRQKLEQVANSESVDGDITRSGVSASLIYIF